jgi:hypothetical protein
LGDLKNITWSPWQEKPLLPALNSNTEKWLPAALGRSARVARFLLVQHTKTGKNIPKDYEIRKI